MSVFYISNIILAAMIYGIPAGLIYIAVRRVRAEKGVMKPGLKGWLFILAVFIWATPLRLLGDLVILVTDETDPPVLRHVDAFLLLCGLASSATCLMLMLTSSRFFPGAFYILVLWNVISLPLSIILSALVLEAHRGEPVGASVMLAAAMAGAWHWGGGLVAGVVWAIYVRRSKRVALTFVR
jgi:hypothetical protein